MTSIDWNTAIPVVTALFVFIGGFWKVITVLRSEIKNISCQVTENATASWRSEHSKHCSEIQENNNAALSESLLSIETKIEKYSPNGELKMIVKQQESMGKQINKLFSEIGKIG